MPSTVSDGLSQWGGVPVASAALFSRNSQYFFVDPANGNDNNVGTSPFEAFEGLEAGEDACTANQHDTVFYIAGSSGNNLAAALTWDKNYTHLIGVAAPTEIAQRARIFQTSTLTGASPLLNITASGCMFKNFYIFQGVADATSLINVQVTGGRNYFENVHFAGGGHATQAIDGGASLKLAGAEENTYYRCTIGVDTVDAATGMMGILFDTETHRETFRECTIRMRAGNGGAGFVEIADSTGIDRDIRFIDCDFLNNSATAMDSAFIIPAGMGAPKKMLLRNCMRLGATTWDTSDRGVLFGNMNAVTGADGSGAAVQLIT